MANNQANKFKLISRDVYQFMYKWRNNYYNHQEYLKITPRQFVLRHKNQLEEITNDLMTPKYTKQKTRKHIHHVNSAQPPDVLVCEMFCMENDNIIKIIGIDKFGYVGISAFGTILTYFGSYDVKKLGTFQYADKLLELIRDFENIKSVDNFIEMVNDLDKIQEHLMIFGDN